MELVVRKSIIDGVFQSHLKRWKNAANQDGLKDNISFKESEVCKTTVARLQALNERNPGAVAFIASQSRFARDVLEGFITKTVPRPKEKAAQEEIEVGIAYMNAIVIDGMVSLVEAFEKEFFAQHMESLMGDARLSESGTVWPAKVETPASAPYCTEDAPCCDRRGKPGRGNCPVLCPCHACSKENPCCDRQGEYNGFNSGFDRLFTCPNGCSCHD